MITKITLLFVTLTMMAGAYGQKPTFELTFSAVNNASYVQLDSIKVMTRRQGGDTLVWYHDIGYGLPGVGRYGNIKENAFSVRCLRDN